MGNVNIKYQKTEREEAFYKTLKDRVDRYFEERHLSRYGNWAISLKIIFLLTLFFTSYGLMISNRFSPGMTLVWAVVFGLTSIMMALNITHDASHNALYHSKKLNQLLFYCFNLIGGSSYLYHLNHVKIHHSFPNVMGIDADLNQPRPFFRLSPDGPDKKIYHYQFLYAPLFYLGYTIFLIFLKDFQDFKYLKKKDSPLLDIQHPRREYVIFWITKVFYVTYALVLPLWLLDIAWWKIILGYLFVNALMSLLALTVQVLIHTNDHAHYIRLDENGRIPRHWAVHTLENTADLHADSRVLTFLLGGLNTHAIHHLFPGICHIHYVPLTRILVETAKEFNLQYTNFTLWESLKSHFNLLKKLAQGKGEQFIFN